MRLWLSLACALVAVPCSSALSLLGEPYTVLRKTNQTVSSSTRILVKCTGQDGRSASRSTTVETTDGTVRSVVFTCDVPELVYLRTLIGVVPRETKVLVSETCTEFVVNLNTTSRRRSHQDSQRSYLTSMRNSGVNAARLNNRRSFGKWASKVLGISAGTGVAPNTDALKRQMDALKTSLGKTEEDLADMLANQTAFNQKTLEGFKGVEDSLKVFAKAEEEQIRLINANKKYSASTTEVIRQINTRTTQAFKETNDAVDVLLDQQSTTAVDLSDLAGNTTAEIRKLYTALRRLANDTTAAVQGLRDTTLQSKKESTDQSITTARAIARLSLAARDARTERQFRNDAARTINELAEQVRQLGYTVFADIQAVPSNEDEATERMLVEELHVTSVGPGVPNWLSAGSSSPTNAAYMHSFALYSKRKFIAGVAAAGLTWDTFLAYLGDGCDSDCISSNTTNNNNTLNDLCQETCNMWIEVRHRYCLLNTTQGEWWKTTNVRSWQSPAGFNESVCAADGIGISNGNVPVREYVYDVQDWVDVRMDACVGGGPDAPITIFADKTNKMFSVTAVDRSICAQGVATAAAQVLPSFDFLFMYIIEKMASLYAEILPLLDRTVYGRLPSGVTTTRADLATTDSGEIGRCMYNVVAAVSNGDWVPVYRYTLQDVKGGVVATVTTDGLDSVLPSLNTSRIAGIQELELALPELYPLRFVGIGEQRTNLANSFIYDVPPSELTTGQARTREGTALYMLAAEQPLTNPVSAWESENGGEIFNHMAASVSAETDRTQTVAVSGKYTCTGSSALFDRGAITEVGMCDRIADGGWLEETDTNGQTTVTLQPMSSSFIKTIEIPSGRFVLQDTTQCPTVTVQPVYGGGVRLALVNTKTASVEVIIRGVSGCSWDKQVWLDGLATLTVMAATCVNEVKIATATEVCYTNFNLTVAATLSLDSIGVFNGAIDGAYVRSAVSTITDDLVIATTTTVLGTNALISELVDTLLRVVITQTNITVPPEDLDHMFNLSRRLSDNAALAVNNSISLTGRPGYEQVNTSEMDESLFGFMYAMDEYTENAAIRVKRLKELNQESEERRQTMSNILDALVDSQERFVKGFGDFNDKLGGVFQVILESMVRDGSSINIGGIGSLISGLGKAASGIGKGLGDVVEGIGDGIGNIVDSAGDLIKDTLGSLASLPFSLFTGSFMTIALLIAVILCYIALFGVVAKLKDLNDRQNRLRGDDYTDKFQANKRQQLKDRLDTNQNNTYKLSVDLLEQLQGLKALDAKVQKLMAVNESADPLPAYTPNATVLNPPRESEPNPVAERESLQPYDNYEEDEKSSLLSDHTKQRSKH
jgi:hypothetical protein